MSVRWRCPVLYLAVCLVLLVPGAAHADACATLARQVDAAGPKNSHGPVFVVSYPTATDKALRHVAFLYDNAAAALALIGCGDTAHAARIGDAMLAAQTRDRFWKDGRLRNAYLAGPLADPVKLGGWQGKTGWVEDGYQVGSDTGNMAWAMLALLGLYHAGAGDKYLKGAVRLAVYVEKSASASGLPYGFTGGTFGGEPKPQRNTWKSTEHNVDLAAAFAQLAYATQDRPAESKHWAMRAHQARAFVNSMWRPSCGCFAVGTGLDGTTPNTFLALDAQLWPLLVLGTKHYGHALTVARARMTVDGGFAYSQARGGVWTEGTAQAALLAKGMGQAKRAAALLAVVDKARTPDGGYYASDRSAPTGFRLDTDPSRQRRYFHLAHLGAAAWVALAARGFNPFTYAYAGNG